MSAQNQKQSTYGLAAKASEAAKKHTRKNSRKLNPFGV